jgi:hypothetical protein
MLNPPQQSMTFEHIAMGNTATLAALISFLRAKRLISPNELRQISGFAKSWIEVNLSADAASLAQGACRSVDALLGPLEGEPRVRSRRKEPNRF